MDGPESAEREALCSAFGIGLSLLAVPWPTERVRAQTAPARGPCRPSGWVGWAGRLVRRHATRLVLSPGPVLRRCWTQRFVCVLLLLRRRLPLSHQVVVVVGAEDSNHGPQPVKTIARRGSEVMHQETLKSSWADRDRPVDSGRYGAPGLECAGPNDDG